MKQTLFTLEKHLERTCSSSNINVYTKPSHLYIESLMKSTNRKRNYKYIYTTADDSPCYC